MATEVILGVAALVVGAVGAGVSYSASTRAASAQEAIGLANAQAQTQALRQQGEVASMQAMINQSLADKDRQAAVANAKALEQQAEVGTRVSMENTRRGREEMARAMSIQRAQIAKSGFVDTTGSPLQLLASSAEEEQRMADEMRYQDEISRRSLFREAAMQRNQGTLAGISGIGALAGGAAARAQAAAGQTQAQLDLYSERAGAAGRRSAAVGSLLGDVGSGLASASNLKRRTPGRFGASSAQAIL
jgi:hypothetical protein